MRLLRRCSSSRLGSQHSRLGSQQSSGMEDDLNVEDKDEEIQCPVSRQADVHGTSMYKHDWMDFIDHSVLISTMCTDMPV